ncbi:FecR domain-containing protein [Xanthomonas sp. F4]
MNQPPPTMDGTVAEQAAAWFLRHREAPLGEPERLAFLEWMQRSPEHVREYLRASRLHREVGEAMSPRRQQDAAAGQAAVAAHPPRAKVVPLFSGTGPRDAVPAVRRPRRRWQVAIAAAACVAIALGALLAHLQSPELLLQAGHGQLRAFTLADGSRVRLNADSVVRVRLGWLARRAELLRGEASFDIAADRRPFQVQVDGLHIRDIGTVFDVARRLQDTRIGVVSGAVEVCSNGANARCLARLDAGRVAAIDHGSRVVRPLSMPASMLLDWQQRKISFLDERLDEVAQAFNRHNTVQVVIADQAAASARLSGSLDAHRVSALQAFLQRDPRLVVQRDGDTVRVSSR